ncbi:MAG: GNAT family N-acetyltransferase [Xanthomonadaceae bacterium]|nr:GNAT family N-acetyltransferase [Xanthomonadaceae bacterium]
MLRDATPADFTAILALNQAFVAVLSPLDRARLASLHAAAAVHRVIERDGCVEAFLLAFREGADYDGANYHWFARRYPRFLYVDRIVVAASAQARGCGRRLYHDVGIEAARRGVPLIACEYDIEPPNPSSARFHGRLGFREVGRRQLGGGKWVSMQLLELAPGMSAEAAAGPVA